MSETDKLIFALFIRRYCEIMAKISIVKDKI